MVERVDELVFPQRLRREPFEEVEAPFDDADELRRLGHTSPEPYHRYNCFFGDDSPRGDTVVHGVRISRFDSHANA
ncbi:hypothetical protein GCM10008994_11400 [Halorubrum ejinorense]|uniref:Uncharacterized protein n=1 Tax=Halorubrum ejinorense TaxID=425309 RepID=A0AAV3SQ21_9EURY